MNLYNLEGCNLFLTLDLALADLFLSEQVPEESKRLEPTPCIEALVCISADVKKPPPGHVIADQTHAAVSHLPSPGPVKT